MSLHKTLRRPSNSGWSSEEKKNVGAGHFNQARVQGHDANKLDTTMSRMYIR